MLGGIAGVMIPMLGMGLVIGGIVGVGGFSTAAGVGAAYYRSERSAEQLEELQ